MTKIVLVHPDIPQNTGNIARTCALVGAGLVLIRPLGFSLTEKKLKRAGLDYWGSVDLEIKDSLEAVLEERPSFFLSTRGQTLYTSVAFPKDVNLVFGSEQGGFPEEFYTRFSHLMCTLPMRPGQRSLNLSNAAAITLYEWWRQHHFIL